MNADKTIQFLKHLNISKKDYTYIKKSLKREPNELELYLFSAMYSEHCAYRHSKKYLKRLPRKFKGKKAVFYKENAGGINIGEHSILFKMESHNHPSAVEPFNGAATGIGGIIRDVLAMNARPIALADSLKFGNLEDKKTQFIFEGVINGISSYGNCIGVPTLEGECDFNEAYTDNPLVNVMALGIAKTKDIITSAAKKNSYIILLGSATMKDGIGGAAFASKDLNDEFEQNRISVQIADPLMEKKLIEAAFEILNKKIALACQDCGAAGILSSTSEMAFKGNCGMNLYLDKVHLAQKNMQPWEIMLSETQERMMFCVEEKNIKEIEKISDKYEIPYSVIGETIEEKHYKLFWENKNIADLPISLISDAPFVKVTPKKPQTKTLEDNKATEDLEKNIHDLINNPSFSSKKWIYSQYDHTVGARTVLPPKDKGASAVWIHEENCFLGIATASRPFDVKKNPYNGTINTVYEAARKLIALGFEPMAITNCLNFANPSKPETMWQFKQSVSGMDRALRHLKIPVVSGNVSFYNESETSKVYPTPTITMVGLCKNFEDIIKREFNLNEAVLVIGNSKQFTDFKLEEKLQKVIKDLKANYFLDSCLPVSKGGIFGAVFKGLAPHRLGFEFIVNDSLFDEQTGRYLIGTNNLRQTETFLRKKKINYTILGNVVEKDFIFNQEKFNSDELFEIYDNRIKHLLN